MAKILKKRSLTDVTHMFVIDAPLIAATARPAQFVILRVREAGERIPISISDYDRAAGTLTLVVQEVGATSRRLCALKEGDDILDIVGPLGNAADFPAGSHVVGIGGGFGTAAMICMMRELSQKGCKTTAINGARRQDLLILVDELKSVAQNVELCTDDGSVGFKGFVTERLKQLIGGDGPGKPDHVIAIGPVVMMKAVAEVTRADKIPTLVSMDPLMVDGTGMCGICRVTVGGKVKFACVDGPCFDAHEVDFAEATRRSKTYVKEEEIAAKRQLEESGKGAA